MQIANVANQDDRKKLIWAILLGVVAIVFLWWTFFGFGGSPPATPSRRPVVSTQTGATGAAPALARQQPARDNKSDLLDQLRPVVYQMAIAPISEAKRNIFAYYEPPAPQPSTMPTPTPTPTPPLLLAAVSPANVYARTGDFTLEVTGDRFTSAMRVTLEGRELPTRYVSPQQLSATVAAALIANPGARQVMVSSIDGKVYSNLAVLNVTPPPTPNYTYVGIIGPRQHNDTAILQDKASREILNVQRGDLLSGRFRVTSISEKELVLVDTNLKIKHTLPFTIEGEKGIGPQSRPTPKADSEDDEP